ncbi:MAG: sulfatase-like hydrolase/transferase, partial [bacterium]|nr:sulfatase-like hydrolase/transferase [bacterium]
CGDVGEELEWSTGEVLRTLDELKLADHTLVIFASDHGPWLAKDQEGGSSGPLREGKGSTWEGGVRVPFIARWPGKIPAGVTTSAFGTTMDLLPTFARLSGAEVPNDRVYDGADISDVLLNNAPGREPLHYYWFRHQLRAVRQGAWKLHVITNSPSNGTREATRHAEPLLFNLKSDPGERTDVAAEHPDVVADLLDLLAEHRRQMRPSD